MTARQAGIGHRLDHRSDTGIGQIAQIAGGALGAVQRGFDNAHEDSFYSAEGEPREG
ncbi:hypothetical protein D3C78_1981290 [compost metagenome]